MNKNIVFISLVLIAGTAGYLFLSPDRPAMREQGQPNIIPPQEAKPVVKQVREHDVSEDQKRRAAMRSEYAELEKARDRVRRQLGKLKSRLWKLQLPPDRARAITEQMQKGYAILKNPPMLGAFFGVDDISRELEKVKRISERLQTLETAIQEDLAAREER